MSEVSDSVLGMQYSDISDDDIRELGKDVANFE